MFCYVYVFTVCQQKELRLLNAEMLLVFVKRSKRKDVKGRNIFHCCLFLSLVFLLCSSSSFRYKTEFGFTLPNRDVIVDDVRVRGVGKSSVLSSINIDKSTAPPPEEKVIEQDSNKN
jgi:hypothetical protein